MEGHFRSSIPLSLQDYEFSGVIGSEGKFQLGVRFCKRSAKKSTKIASKEQNFPKNHVAKS
jgi:hypothetical protein